jgi:hypothetical protein
MRPTNTRIEFCRKKDNEGCHSAEVTDWNDNWHMGRTISIGTFMQKNPW